MSDTLDDVLDESSESQEIVDLQRRAQQLEKKLDRYRSGHRIIVDTVERIFETLPRVQIPKLPKAQGDGEHQLAVAHVSDTQLGKWTTSYNMVVARERLLKFARKIVSISNVKRRHAKVEEIHLYLGGDLVEGENIFPHQAHLLDAHLLEQSVRGGPEIFTEMILYLLDNFKRVVVLSVPGNHGRDSKFSHPDTNWDTVCAEVVRATLLGTTAFPRPDLAERLEFRISPDWHIVDRLPGGWANLLVHGHQIKGGFGGFPFYGVGKKMSGWADIIDEPWDYLFFGHFHTFGSLVVNYRLWLANGSTESDNEYAKESIASQNTPCQRLCFFNEQHGLISDHQVILDERVPQAKRFLPRDPDPAPTEG